MGVLVCEIILGILVFFTGTCVFSFLNVVIYRVPRQMSVSYTHLDVYKRQPLWRTGYISCIKRYIIQGLKG